MASTELLILDDIVLSNYTYLFSYLPKALYPDLELIGAAAALSRRIIKNALVKFGLLKSSLIFVKNYSKFLTIPLLWLYCQAAMKKKGDNSLPFLSSENPLGDILVINLNPHKISRLFRVPREDPHPFIRGGDWDLEAGPFEQHGTYVVMAELIENQLRHRETKGYKRRIAEVAAGTPRARRGRILDTIEKVEQYYEERIGLFNALKAHGYRSQAALGDSDNEIAVAIGRNGEVIKYLNGNHRLAAAKLLNLDEVVVAVRCVHPLWVERCLEKYGGSPLSAIRKGLGEVQGTPAAEKPLAKPGLL